MVDDAYQYLMQSYHSFEAWGAISKTKQLVHVYPLIVEKIRTSKRKHSAISDGQLEVDNNSLASVSLLTNGSFCTFNSSYLRHKQVRFS